MLVRTLKAVQDMRRTSARVVVRQAGQVHVSQQQINLLQ
jgi:hypothetical protein